MRHIDPRPELRPNDLTPTQHLHLGLLMTAPAYAIRGRWRHPRSRLALAERQLIELVGAGLAEARPADTAVPGRLYPSIAVTHAGAILRRDFLQARQARRTEAVRQLRRRAIAAAGKGDA